MKSNYYKFLFANSILFFGIGLFGPFWVIFVREYGGVEQFGFAMGLMILAQSVTSYFVGKYSDRLGRKIFLVGGGIIMSGTIFSYTIIHSVIALYILQIIYGIVVAVEQTLEKTMLGDLTEKTSRGANIGKYEATITAVIGIATMIGGLIVGKLGVNIIFYITSALVFVSSMAILRIKTLEKDD